MQFVAKKWKSYGQIQEKNVVLKGMFSLSQQDLTNYWKIDLRDDNCALYGDVEIDREKLKNYIVKYCNQ